MGNRPRNLEHAMKYSRTEPKLLTSRRRAHQRLSRRVELAHFAHTHIGGPLRVSALHTTRLS